jgi:hypothetical protein
LRFFILAEGHLASLTVHPVENFLKLAREMPEFFENGHDVISHHNYGIR